MESRHGSGRVVSGRSSPDLSDPGGANGEQGVELSPEDLSPEALRGLVEAFVSREGTDYGQVDRSLAGKVADVVAQLATGEARIVFDLESETASIVLARDLHGHGRR